MKSLGFKRRFSKVRDLIETRIRDKAISRAKTRIYLHGRKPEDYEEQVLETIVKEEEDKIKGELKDKSIVVLLALLGISFWS